MPRGRRNLVLFVLVVVVLGGVVAGMGIVGWPPKGIMPPEAREITAKRASPENAFYVCMEGWPELPPRPERALVPSSSDPRKTDRYRPKMNSIGYLLVIMHPDDDEAVGQWLRACAPIVANGQEALTKEFFLYPAIGTPLSIGESKGREGAGKLDYTLRLLTAHMLYAAQQARDEERCVGYFTDAIRFAEMLGSDGSIEDYQRAAVGLYTVLQCAADAASHLESRERLRAMGEAVNRLTLHERPARPYLEFTWREIGNWAEKGFLAHSDEVGRRQGLSFRRSWKRSVRGVMEAWKFKRHCKALRELHEELVPIAELTYGEFSRRRQSDLAEVGQRLSFCSYGGLGDIGQFITARELLQDGVQAAGIALSLESYRREHGGYPERLDALTPDYLDAIPSEVYPDIPFIYLVDDAPFIYRAAGDDYWLYPSPEHAQSRRMDAYIRYDFVFHRPLQERWR